MRGDTERINVRLKIAEVALSKGYRIHRLTQESRTSSNTMDKYWHNKATFVDLGVLARIAKVLNVKVTDLIVNPEDETEEDKTGSATA